MDSDVEIFCADGVVTEPFCADCFTWSFCNGHGTAVTTRCPAEKPFCNSGSCSKVRDPELESLCEDQILEQKLTCSDEGYFPEPSNCQQFYLCPDPTIIPALPLTKYVCPENYVYDSINFKCKIKKLPTDCVTMECRAANSFVPYIGNANYYGFCKTVGSAPLLFKCATGLYFNFDKFGCEFRCVKEGYFASPKCNQFYHCYKSGTNLVAKLEICPSGHLWDATLKTCLKDTAGKCK